MKGSDAIYVIFQFLLLLGNKAIYLYHLFTLRMNWCTMKHVLVIQRLFFIALTGENLFPPLQISRLIRFLLLSGA